MGVALEFFVVDFEHVFVQRIDLCKNTIGSLSITLNKFSILVWCVFGTFIIFPANIYLFKVNNRNTKCVK